MAERGRTMKGMESKLRAIEAKVESKKVPMCILTAKDGTLIAADGLTAVVPVCSGQYVKALTDDENIACLLSALGGDGFQVKQVATEAILKPYRDIRKEMKKRGVECI